MSSTHNPVRRFARRTIGAFAACVAVAAGLGAYGLSAAGAATKAPAAPAAKTFTFALKASPGDRQLPAVRSRSGLDHPRIAQRRHEGQALGHAGP